jgi:hypothetical protein
MDDVVLQAMARWPNVPAVYGWLSLDPRGRWRVGGELVINPALAGFIGRNYMPDDRGCWFFQNGPQRVFVDLHYAPWVYRAWSIGEQGMLAVESHTGLRVHEIIGLWSDDSGYLLLETEHGVGTMEDASISVLLDSLTDHDGKRPSGEELLNRLDSKDGGASGLRLKWARRSVSLQRMRREDVPGHFGFIASPRPRG